MTTQEMTTSDVELALELLNKHKEAQKQKEIDEERKKQMDIAEVKKLIKVFDDLKIPYEDIICLTYFAAKKTLIWGYTVKLEIDKKNDTVISSCSQYEAKYIKGCSSEKLERRQSNNINLRGLACGNVDVYNETTEGIERGKYEKKKTHNFYTNNIHVCPFCNECDVQDDKTSWDYKENQSPAKQVQYFNYLINYRDTRWDWDGKNDIKQHHFHSEPIKYKRCRWHKDQSHKQYLAEWKHPSWSQYDEPEKKKLFDAMYPSPLEHDEDYFMDKRNRKLELKQDYVTAINDDVDDCDFDYRYDYTGNVYLMSNNHTGRTKIGMTKNEPKFRESTLQSEDPDVELAFSSRVLMMRDTERYLHEHFAGKRYRGEWFDLSDEEVEEAKSLIEKATIETL